jgi:hypothetical protein
VTRIPKFWRLSLPLSFLFLYLGTIFGFAWAYYSMPGQFYHSTIEHEASMRDDAAYIKCELSTSVISSYKESHGGSSILSGDGWVASVDDLKLSDMAYKNRTFSFSVNLPKQSVNSNRPNGEQAADFVMTWSFPRDEAGLDTQIDRSGPTGKKLYISFSKWPNEQSLFKLMGGQVGGDTGCFRLDPEMVARMVAYADAVEGLPGRASGSFWRMFYLSAVTITTLGYGDILPITALARILVSSEAIAGTIIIGLYLWALTQHIEARRQS